jgi:hypothetical protein
MGYMYVLEVGSGSAAGLYACDTDALVLAMNESAIKEYEEVHSVISTTA